jgi:hypothetical protein
MVTCELAGETLTMSRFACAAKLHGTVVAYQ